jgi:ComEC/Rec2-related protein
MHVIYVITGISFILDKFIKRRKLKNYILIFFLIFFAIFTGGSSSCIRACIMTGMNILAQNLYRKNDAVTSWLIALDIILFINPYNIESVGMWLSFIAAFSLIKSDYIFENFKRLFAKFHINLIKNNSMEIDSLKKSNLKENVFKKYILENLKISLTVNMLIFPIVWIVYNTISLTFLISNLFASFLIGLIF